MVKNKQRYTTIDESLYGLRLYRWRKGLRMRGCLRGGCRYGGRVYFDDRELEHVPVGQGHVIRRVRALTDEVWMVLRKQGRFWRSDGYLVPPRALEVAQSRLDAENEALKCPF